MDVPALVLGLALPWCLGLSLLLAFDWPRPAADGGASGSPTRGHALRLGYGYFIGVLLITLWMRALAFAGTGFSRLSIGVPLLAATTALLLLASRQHGLSLAAVRDTVTMLIRPPLPRWQRVGWALLLAWLAFRFAALAVEVAWRPLYPWDAWTQWATKARVWYELSRIVPFVPADAWLAGQGGAFFDAAPGAPATIPLLQAWGSIALGRWDDSAMNWPWLLMLVALALAAYGAFRDAAIRPLGALIGAYLVVSLPLVDAHVALAGDADLMLSGVYALAALAFHRWARGRDMRDGVLALLLALSCPLIQTQGVVWALTLVPGIVVALLPRRGLKLVAWSFGVVALALLVLARTRPTLRGISLHLDYGPAWRTLLDVYLVLGNWHLLWYGAAALAIVGARRLVRPPLAPLASVVAAALAFLLVTLLFPGNVAAWSADFAAINRTTLHVAPLLACLCVLLWAELSAPGAESPPAVVQTGTPVSTASLDA
jgi:hypothetical protein